MLAVAASVALPAKVARAPSPPFDAASRLSAPSIRAWPWKLACAPAAPTTLPPLIVRLTLRPATALSAKAISPPVAAAAEAPSARSASKVTVPAEALSRNTSCPPIAAALAPPNAVRLTGRAASPRPTLMPDAPLKRSTPPVEPASANRCCRIGPVPAVRLRSPAPVNAIIAVPSPCTCSENARAPLSKVSTLKERARSSTLVPDAGAVPNHSSSPSAGTRNGDQLAASLHRPVAPAPVHASGAASRQGAGAVTSTVHERKARVKRSGR